MNKLLYSLFLSVFLLDYLSIQLGLISRYMTWLPELLSVITILIIVMRITLGYGKYIPLVCGIYLTLFVLHIVIGVAVNRVPTGPIIAGLRTYIKFIPFFILPFVYDFSTKQVNQQLKLLLILFVIQLPIALYQRLVLSKGHLSGDAVSGTISTSGQLTVILTCAIAVLMAFYLAKKIDLISFITIFSVLFIPLTLNETKSTVLFLPIAMLLPVLFSLGGVKLRQFIPIISIMVLAGIVFVFVYDHFMRPKWGYGIMDFLAMEGRAEKYLYKGVEAGTHYGDVGRIDSLVLAFSTLSENILTLLFGLGIGNVSESFIPSLSGEYAEKYSSFKVKFTSLTLILWELGLLGVFLYYYLFFMVFKYSRRVSMQEGFQAVIASGWSVVAVIIMIATAYKSVFSENIFGYLFWYLSGYVISENFRDNRMR